MHRAIFTILFLFSQYALASTVQELDKRNIADLEKPNGKAYEKEVVQKFWGNPHFMMQCIPPDSRIHKPFTIYIEILETGQIGQLAFTLDTEVTKCIESFVREKHFKKPKAPFVAKINMNFTK